MTTTPLADRLRDASGKWEGLLPGLPDQVPGQNGMQIPKQALSDWFALVIAGVSQAETSNVEPGIKSIYWQNIVNGVANTENHVATAAANGPAWAQQTTNALLGYLWSIRSCLTWFAPLPVELLLGDRAPVIAELSAQADAILTIAARASETEGKVRAKLADIESAGAEVAAATEKIFGYERSATTANTNAAASATATEAEKQKVDAHVTELDAAVLKQRELFELFEEKRTLVEQTLQGASRVALAQSFEKRRVSLLRIQYVWAALFALGIGALTWFGFHLASDILHSATPSTVPALTGAAPTSGASAVTTALKPDSANMLFSLLRFLVLAPVVWFTWFAARQYGHSQRLGEDYAFKSAAAHAFVGYKEEMGDDSHMLQMLREFAVKNFGANPIRVLSKNEPATPLHDILERILDKISPDKLPDVLEAISKIKG